MFDQILFPTDGSQGTDRVLDHVLDVAAANDATVHVLNVANTTHSAVRHQEEVVATLLQRAEQVVRRVADRAAERGVATVTEIRQGNPYREIVEYAESSGVDLVAMPTHGRRGLERLLVGSTTERVVRRADVPVLTLRPSDDIAFDYPYESVLVPTDGSDCAKRALERSVAVADAEGAPLHLLSVVPVGSLGVDVRSDVVAANLEASAREVLDRAAESATAAGVEPTATTVEFGASVHEAILTYVDDHDVDLVVVGTHGRTGFDRYLLGSVTEYLVRTSPVPVLTVRGPNDDR